MSTEIYVQGFDNQNPAGLPRRNVIDIFGLSDGSGPFSLVYDEQNSCEVSLSDGGSSVSRITIFRPCDHPDLYAALYNLLLAGPYVAHSPGSQPVVVNSGVVPSIPPALVQAMGEPIQVSSARDLVKSLFAA